MPRDYSISQELIRALRQLRHVHLAGRKPVDGCTPSETMLLFVVRRGTKTKPEGLRTSELSGLLRVTMPTVTQLVNVLEARGLLARHPDPLDRRVVRIVLTEEGWRQTEQAQEVMLQSMKGLVDHMGEDRCRELIGMLDEVSGYFSGEPPTPAVPDHNSDSTTK